MNFLLLTLAAPFAAALPTLGATGTTLGATLGHAAQPVTDLTHSLDVTKRDLGAVGGDLGSTLGHTAQPVTDLTHSLDVTKRDLGAVGGDLGSTLGHDLQPVTDLTHSLQITKRDLGAVGSSLGDTLGEDLQPVTDLTHGLQITKRAPLHGDHTAPTLAPAALLNSITEDLRGGAVKERQLLGEEFGQDGEAVDVTEGLTGGKRVMALNA